MGQFKPNLPLRGSGFKFIQMKHQALFKVRGSSLFKWRVTPFSKGDNKKNSINTMIFFLNLLKRTRSISTKLSTKPHFSLNQRHSITISCAKGLYDLNCFSGERCCLFYYGILNYGLKRADKSEHQFLFDLSLIKYWNEKDNLPSNFY